MPSRSRSLRGNSEGRSTPLHSSNQLQVRTEAESKRRSVPGYSDLPRHLPGFSGCDFDNTIGPGGEESTAVQGESERSTTCFVATGAPGGFNSTMAIGAGRFSSRLRA